MQATSGEIVRIFSTDTDSGTVTVVDRDGREFRHVTTVSVGNAPRGAVKFTADGRGFVSNCGGDTISEIDALSGHEVGRIRVGPAPRGIGILPGDRFALVSSSGDDFVSIVDLDRRTQVGRVATARDPRHMAITKDGRAAYVAVWGGHHIAKLDTSALASDAGADPDAVREVARIDVGDGAHPYSLTIAPDGSRAVVANTQASYASVIDVAEDRVTDRIELGSKGARAVAFAPDGGTIYISIEDTSEVAAVDAATLRLVSRWPVGPGPRGIALDPGAAMIYTSGFARQSARPGLGGEFHANTLTVIDLEAARAGAEAAIGEIAVGKGPCSVSVIALDRLTGGKRAGT